MKELKEWVKANQPTTHERKIEQKSISKKRVNPTQGSSDMYVDGVRQDMYNELKQHNHKPIYMLR